MIKNICRQTTISLKAEPSLWLKRIITQLNGFPVFIRSCEAKHGRKITRYSIHDRDEMHSWIKVLPFSSSEILLSYFDR